jgi:hypothetical protein
MTRESKKSPAAAELKAASPSGLPIDAVVTAADLHEWDPERDLGYPGEFPLSLSVKSAKSASPSIPSKTCKLSSMAFHSKLSPPP